MWGFQAAGAAPLVLGHPVTSPDTVATAIRIGNPASTQLAVAAKNATAPRAGPASRSASGSCEVTYMGRNYSLTDPEVIDYEAAAPAFPRYELLQFRFVGIAQYLRMQIL